MSFPASAPTRGYESPYREVVGELENRGRSPNRRAPGSRSHSSEARSQLASPDIRRVQYNHDQATARDRAIPPPRPSPFRYNLPPSEPIYHDIEQERIHRARSFSPGRPGSEYEKRTDLVFSLQTKPPRISEQVQQRARRERKQEGKPASMIIFSDAFAETGSVLTGWSEQELLQKRKKHDKRRDKPKYGRKKIKESRILNMPPSLRRPGESPVSEASASRSRVQYLKSDEENRHGPDVEANTTRRRGLISRIQKRTVPLATGQEGTPDRSPWRLMQSRSNEELESSHSSHASSAVPDVDNNVTYASFPIDRAELGDMRQTIPMQSEDLWTTSPQTEEPLPPGAFPVRPSDLIGHVRSDNLERPRVGSLVRFGPNIEHRYSEHVLLDASSGIVPSEWNANHASIEEDHESPVSVMSVQKVDGLSSGGRGAHAYASGTAHKSYPKSKYPKSILRNGGRSKSRGSEVVYDGATLKTRSVDAHWSSPKAAAKPRGVECPVGPPLSPLREVPSRDSHSTEPSPTRTESRKEIIHASWDAWDVGQYHEDDTGSSEGVDFIEAVASVVIQTVVRRHLAKVTVEKRRADSVAGEAHPLFENMAVHMFELAAIQIQSSFRGWWVRDCLSVDRYCATRIQKVFRGYTAKMRYLYALYRIILVQAIWRRNLTMNAAAHRLANVIVVQSVYRDHLTRMNSPLLNEDKAATIIQSTWRMYDAQMFYLSDLAAVLIVQSIVRRWFVASKIAPYMYSRPLGSSDCLVMDKHRYDRDMREPMPLRSAKSTATPARSESFADTRKLSRDSLIQAETIPKVDPSSDSVDAGAEMVTVQMVRDWQKRENSKAKMSSAAANFWQNKSKGTKESRRQEKNAKVPDDSGVSFEVDAPADGSEVTGQYLESGPQLSVSNTPAIQDHTSQDKDSIVAELKAHPDSSLSPEASPAYTKVKKGDRHDDSEMSVAFWRNMAKVEKPHQTERSRKNSVRPVGSSSKREGVSNLAVHDDSKTDQRGNTTKSQNERDVPKTVGHAANFWKNTSKVKDPKQPERSRDSLLSPGGKSSEREGIAYLATHDEIRTNDPKKSTELKAAPESDICLSISGEDTEKIERESISKQNEGEASSIRGEGGHYLSPKMSSEAANFWKNMTKKKSSSPALLVSPNISASSERVPAAIEQCEVPSPNKDVSSRAATQSEDPTVDGLDEIQHFRRTASYTEGSTTATLIDRQNSDLSDEISRIRSQTESPIGQKSTSTAFHAVGEFVDTEPATPTAAGDDVVVPFDVSREMALHPTPTDLNDASTTGHASDDVKQLPDSGTFNGTVTPAVECRGVENSEDSIGIAIASSSSTQSHPEPAQSKAKSGGNTKEAESMGQVTGDSAVTKSILGSENLDPRANMLKQLMLIKNMQESGET